MVRTRKKVISLKEKTDDRRQERERLAASVRADMLDITEGVAEDIVRTQNELGDRRFGCRKNGWTNTSMSTVG